VRIGVDVSYWQNTRGFGRFTRELVQALVCNYAPMHEFVLVADQQTAEAGGFPDQAERVVVRTRRQPMQAESADSWRGPLDLLRLGWKAGRCGADVFWFPAVSAYYPVLGRVPVVITVHDAMPETRPDLFFPTKRARLFWQAKTAMAHRQAVAVVTPSESARQGVAAVSGRPVESITRIDEAPAPIFGQVNDAVGTSDMLMRLGLAEKQPLLLYVGGINPHKNLESLLRALAGLRQNGVPCFHLALVGEEGKDSALGCYREIMALRRELGLEDHVTLTGFVSDADLVLLYNAADALILPSLDEGFGLPVVEAMACGLPVAVSARGALPDLVGDAGLSFDPLDVSSITQAIARLLRDADLRRTLGERGLARAQEFSWARSARQMMAVFETAVQG
jgi:glycosyltransferase involved in cell wall biosynthesis